MASDHNMTQPLGRTTIDYTEKNTLSYQLSHPIGLVPSEYKSTRTGWLKLPTPDAEEHIPDQYFTACQFGISFTPGAGAIIHKDLFDRLSSDATFKSINPEYGWDENDRKGSFRFRSSQWLKFSMPLYSSYAPELEIIGETIFSFALRRAEPKQPFIICKVKAVVTSTPLPLELNHTGEPQLMWIGVGKKAFPGEESLLYYDMERKEVYKDGEYVAADTIALRTNTKRTMVV